MKNLKKILFSALFAIICFSPFSFLANADSASPALEQEKQTGAFSAAAGLNPTVTIGQVTGLIIETLLGFLAIIFVALLIFAGFQWMTAQGNEEKVEKSQKTIVRAIIGLAIVIAAYAITYFVFNSLNSAI
jgi:amino acid transporter